MYRLKLAATLQMPNQQIHFHLHGNGCLFMWGAYFCMGAYKHSVVVAIKMVPIFMDAYFLWVPIIHILWYKHSYHTRAI